VIVLDTSALSMVFRRSSAATPHPVLPLFRRLVEDDAPLAVPGVVYQELLSGVKSASAFQALEEALSGFTLLLADKAIHRVAAETQASCRARGVSAASFDALIAAHTLVVGGELLTLDNDFRHIAPVVGLRLTPV
jgi:predicted nucleic acid-binding protein